MANSKYEYVKLFEAQDEIMFPNFILVKVAGRDFTRFSELHGFEKPYDEAALRLMNECAIRVMEVFPDIALAYGFSDEYSFVFKRDTKIYQRRASKILSLVASLFSSVYVLKWKEFFPQKELKLPPSFKSRVISCAKREVLQTYLSWRQRECHLRNLYDTCFWNLMISSGKSEEQAKEILKGSGKQEQNEMLFQMFNINYKELPVILRQGSCVIQTEVKENGRLRKEAVVVHERNIVAPAFWNVQPCLVSELGRIKGGISTLKPEYLKSFTFENNLTPASWIVIRIDGCHFHRFSEVHQFDKPNDEQAMHLINKSAVALMEEFRDIVFCYGESDEYSFVLKKDTSLYGRCASDIVSAFVSFFSAVYVMQWKANMQQKELKYPPHFDGRSVCYPTYVILDYLAWRQVDCHINNQYNTCFWMLVKSGKSKSEAQKVLKGTQTLQKIDLLKKAGIDYDALPSMFRLGSSIFWDKEENMKMDGNGDGTDKHKLVVEYCDIIEKSFWEAHPNILNLKIEDGLPYKLSRILDS